MRNGLVVLQPFVCFGNRSRFLFGDVFILNGCAAQVRRHGIDDGFQQSDQCRELELRQPVYQPVSVLTYMARQQAIPMQSDATIQTT